MKPFSVIAASLLLAGLMTTPAREANAQTICLSDTLAMPGGWLITGCAVSGHRVSGFGTTMTDAGSNQASFTALSIASDTRCIVGQPFSDIKPVNGGYFAYYQCRKPGRTRWIQGAGNTATETGINTYGFAELFATHGVSCILGTSPYLIPGGMKIEADCSTPVNTMYGAGSNLRDAANNALGFANLSADVGRKWSVDTIQAYPGRYEVRASRGAKTVVGQGSTVTDAANSALMLASLIP